MTQDDLLNRLRRIYATLNAIVVFDMTKLTAKYLQCGTFVGIYQDFRGGLSSEEMANFIHSVNHNIASLKDHLKKWARAHGKDVGKIDGAMKNSLDLRLIYDLWDVDKHGGARRDGGYSGLTPWIKDIDRVMRLQTQAKAGAAVTMTLGPDGVPVIRGDGSGLAVITADVVDPAGKVIGDLFEIQERAVKAWEALLNDYGVLL